VFPTQREHVLTESDLFPSSVLTSYDSNDAEYDSEPSENTIELEDRPMPSIEATIQAEMQEEEDELDEDTEASLHL
jgi:hypothetical protein